MNKFLKITLSIIVGLTLLVGLSIGGLILFINPNNFKPQIVEVVKNKIGRDLTIEGDLKLTLYPDVSIKTGKMTLNNTPEFANQPPLAILNESRISVKLLPLLSKNLEVQGMLLQGLTLNLVTNAQGVNNWQDLNKSAPATKKPASTSVVTGTGAAVFSSIANAPNSALINAFSIGNIYLINGQINWQDLQNNQTTQLKDLTLSAEKIKFNQPVPIYLAFVTNHSENNNIERVKLTAKLIANEAFDQIQLSDTQIQTTSTGDTIPNKSFNSTLNITQINSTPQTVTVNGLQFKAGDIALTSDFTVNSLKENPAFQGNINIAAFNPTNMLKDFAIPAPPEVSKLTNFALTTDIKATMASLELSSLLLTLNDTVIKGSFNSSPVITVNLDINQLNVDNYFPPKDNRTIPVPSLLLATGATAMPAGQLRELNFRSNLKIEQLKVHGLDLQDVQIHTVADKGLIRNHQSIKLYQGEYAGNLTLDARPAQLTMGMEENIKNLQLEPFLQALKGKAKVRGTLNASVMLKGEGQIPEAFIASSKGFVKLACTDGAIRGVSLPKILMQSKNLAENTELNVETNNEETAFSEISGTAHIDKGVLTNQDLKIKTTPADAKGQGTINFNNELLDYKITATAAELQSIPLVINVGGTLSKPRYTLDISALLNEVKKKIDTEKLLEQVKSQENKAKIEHALDKLKPEEKEKLEKLAPKAEKLLKKLFR